MVVQTGKPRTIISTPPQYDVSKMVTPVAPNYAQPYSQTLANEAAATAAAQEQALATYEAAMSGRTVGEATNQDFMNNTSLMGGRQTGPANSADFGVALSPQDLIDMANRLLNGTEFPNPLNSAWQITYHWRFFIINDNDLYLQAGKPATIADLYAKIDNLNPIIIAETGDTTYNIKSVELQSKVGPNSDTYLSSFYGLTMTIVEPISVGFLEALKDAAVAANIQNVNKCIYYVELSFKGYDETTGAILSSPLEAALASNNNGVGFEATRWIWQVVIGDIDTNVDVGGATYVLTMIPSNDQRFDADIGAVPQVTVISGNTIKTMLDNLATSMNANWKANFGNDLVTYDFNMHPLINAPASATSLGDPNNFRMTASNPQQNSTRITAFESNGAVTGQFAAGISYSDIITWIIANNEKSQDLMMDRDGKTGEVDASQQNTNSKQFKESIIFRIETDIEIVDYDIVDANYRKKVHVHIWPYYTQAILTGPVQRQNALSQPVQNDMLAALLKQGFVKKHYNYLYTGINTEVLDFKLHHNFNWSALLPKAEGARGTIDAAEAAARATKASLTPGGNTSEVSDLTGKGIAELQALDQANHDASLDNAEALRNATVMPDIVAAAVQIAPDKQTPDQQAAVAAYRAKIAQLTASGQAIGNAQVTYKAAIAKEAARINPPPAPLSQVSGDTPGDTVRYAEDFIAADGSTIDPAITRYQYEWFNYALSYRQAYLSSMRQSGTGMTGQYHRDRSMYGALLDQMFEPMGVYLNNVEVEIRGDPFWIGQTNLTRQVLLRGGDASKAGSQLAAVATGLPNFYAGDQAFLLTFRFPVTVGDDYVPQFKSADTMNGIYRMSEVTSTFADGKFTQKLSGMILPLLNVGAAFNMKPPVAGGNLGYSSSNSGSNSGSSGGSSGSTNSSGHPSGPVNSTPSTSQQQANAQAFRDALAASASAKGITLTSAQIDGIVANAYRESGMNPNAGVTDTNGLPSGGLLQWNGARGQAFAAYEGGTLPQNATIDQQADFTIHELMTTEKGTLTALQQTTTAADAANVWITKYERPANPSAGQTINLQKLQNLYSNGSGS